jgi:hypothetical protein
MPPSRYFRLKVQTFIRPLLLVPLLVSALSCSARAAEDPYRETALDLVRKLVLAFPPAEGYVVSMPAGEVYLDLAEDQLMRPGMELLVYREGAEIVHPVSGDVLGRYEERLGYVTLTEVQEKYSVGTLVEGAKEVQAGDRVRISARPLRVLLLFLSESPAVDAGRLARDLADAADESRRFRLRDEPEWLPRLKEMGMTIGDLVTDPASLRRLGGEGRADLLLVVDPGTGEDASIGLEARSLWTGRTLADFRQPWRIAEEPPAAAGQTPSSPGVFSRAGGRPVETREYVRKDLSSSALSILAGDLRGEGGLDILVTDGRGLTLYTWEQGGLIWTWEDGAPRGQHVLGLESADLDGDGRVEVLVTVLDRGRLATRTISWGRGEWDERDRAEGLYVRTFEKPGGGLLVLGQRAGVDTVFLGPVLEYVWEDGSFLPADGLTLPAGVNIFGLGVADVDGDGTVEVLSLNEGGNIRTFSAGGERLDVTGERYGGYPPRIDAETLFGPNLVDGGYSEGFFKNEDVNPISGKDAGRDIRAAFQGRLLAVRQDDGALLGIVVPRNFSGAGAVLPDMRQFDKGSTVLMEWEDGRFVEVLRSRKQEGWVADVALADTDGDGREEIIMAVNRPTGALLRKKGALVVWKYHMQGREGAGEGEQEKP